MSILVTAAIILKEEKILIAQRKAGGHLEGLWEFPGGKIEKGETPENSLIREIDEELHMKVEIIDIFHAVHHQYPEKDILLVAYLCKHLSGEGQSIDCQDFKWVTINDMNNFQFAPADIPIINKLKEGILNLD